MAVAPKRTLQSLLLSNEKALSWGAAEHRFCHFRNKRKTEMLYKVVSTKVMLTGWLEGVTVSSYTYEDEIGLEDAINNLRKRIGKVRRDVCTQSTYRLLSVEVVPWDGKWPL